MLVLVVTSSSRLPWWRSAAAGLARHVPDAEVVPVWSDARLLARPGRGVALRGRTLGRLRWEDLVLGLGERPAAWALVPSLIDELAPEGPVAVLDDTVRVLGPVPALLEGERAVVRAAGVDPTSGLPFGGALPGVLSLPAPAPELLSWWSARAAVAAADEGAAGLDDLWRDLPVGAVADVVTDDAYRWSARTADAVALELDGTTPVAAGAPLRLVDLDGLDPARPWWFGPDGEAPRVRSSRSPAQRALLHAAVDDLRDEGWCEDGGAPLPLVVGRAVTAAERRRYRRELAAGRVPPNPLLPGGVGPYLDELAAPGDDGTGISVDADLLLEARPDVAAAFPSARWADRDRLVRWMWTHGLDEGATSLATLPDLPRPTTAVRVGLDRSTAGVNVVGYLSGDLGLGVAARQMVTALEAAGVPVAQVAYDRTSSRLSGPAPDRPTAPYGTNLLLITPDQLPYFVEDAGPAVLAGRRNIGLWYWETDVLTDRQLSSFPHVHEVWGATEYLCDVFRRYDRVPVAHVPVPLVFDDPALRPGDREALGLDDRFTVVFSFDFLSVADRKNPLGLVEAFRRAFGPDDGARLVLKSINGEVFPEQLERVLDAIADMDDVELRDEYLSARDRLALVALADCYASLHRSEGLGLTMAEAMALGTPVVATAYSGNLDFMDDSSALLVPAAEVRIGPGHFYPADGHWAEPDLDAAAAALRRLRDEPDLRARLAEAGRAALEPFGYRAVGDVAAARLRELGLIA